MVNSTSNSRIVLSMASFEAKMWDTLEMLDPKHRVVDDVRQLKFLGEIIGDQPLGELMLVSNKAPCSARWKATTRSATKHSRW